jgi:hypothetical protein
MIMPELEMRPIARRGTTTEELELRRYAASELRGHPRCLLVEIVEMHGDRRRNAEITEEHWLKRFFSGATANT